MTATRSFTAPAAPKKRQASPLPDEPASPVPAGGGSPSKKIKVGAHVGGSPVNGDNPADAEQASGRGKTAVIHNGVPGEERTSLTDVLGTGTENTMKITTLTRPYITEPAITRINRMLEYSNDINKQYALRLLPFEGLQWGPASPEKDNPSLYLHHDNKSLTIWIIGELCTFSTSYRNAQGHKYNARKVTISVKPFHAVDLIRANRLVDEQRMPTTTSGAATDRDRIWAQRWMAPFGTTVDEVPPFADCYDATEKWAGKDRSDHLALPPTTLGRQDVVLVEAALKRRFETERVADRYTRTNQNRWFVDFDILSVALLLRAPKSVEGSGFSKKIVDFEI